MATSETLSTVEGPTVAVTPSATTEGSVLTSHTSTTLKAGGTTSLRLVSTDGEASSAASTSETGVTSTYASTNSDGETGVVSGSTASPGAGGSGAEGSSSEGRVTADTKGTGNGGFPLYAAGIISGILVILVVLGCGVGVCCCYVLRRGSKFHPNNLRRHQSKQLPKFSR